MRILHTMLRVGQLQRSIDFYTQVLGMKLLRTSENPQYKYSLAFLGYGSNPDHAELELTYNWGVEQYEMGTAYGHIALAVPDAHAARAVSVHSFAELSASDHELEIVGWDATGRQIDRAVLTR